MRELTDKEKKLCRELIDKDKQEHHQLRVGDVLHGLYGFDCIEKDSLGAKYPDSPFKIRLICLSAKRQDIVEELNEAISLLLMLRDKGMISFVDSKSDKCFGDNTPKMYGLKEEEHSDAAMMDYFDVNTWQLLNSYYYISNSFKDYCRKSFKTVEQRRFEKTIIVASLTLILTAVALVVSIRSCRQSKSITCPYESTKEIIFQNQPKDMIKTSTSDTIIALSSDTIPNTKTP